MSEFVLIDLASQFHAINRFLSKQKWDFEDVLAWMKSYGTVLVENDGQRAYCKRKEMWAWNGWSVFRSTFGLCDMFRYNESTYSLTLLPEHFYFHW